jgi:hypothetical protein
MYIIVYTCKPKESYSMTSNGIITLPKNLELSVWNSWQVESLPEEDAKYHLQRCEDSGLWVPSSEVPRGKRGDGDVDMEF